MTKGLCSALSITKSKSVSQLCHIHYFSSTIWLDEQIKCATGAMLLHQTWPNIIIIIINMPWWVIVCCVCYSIVYKWCIYGWKEETAPPPMVAIHHKHFVQCSMKKL